MISESLVNFLLIVLPLVGGIYITLHGWGILVKDDFRTEPTRLFWKRVLPFFKLVGPLIILQQVFLGVVTILSKGN